MVGRGGGGGYNEPAHRPTSSLSVITVMSYPQIWNDIPLSLRNSLTLSSYKHKLRDYFQSL